MDNIKTKKIYELSKKESMIVNEAIKCLISVVPVKMHIKDVEIVFNEWNWCEYVNEYQSCAISRILVDCDIGYYKIIFYNDIYDHLINTIVKYNGCYVKNLGLKPEVKYYHHTTTTIDDNTQIYFVTLAFKKHSKLSLLKAIIAHTGDFVSKLVR